MNPHAPLRRLRRRTLVGAAGLPVVLLGLVMLVFGVYVKGQPWTTPEMFKDLGLDLGKTIVGVGWILIFIQLIKGFFYAPLDEAIQARNSELESTFTDAENLRTQMDQLKGEYEQRLATTEATAREQIQAQVREAQQIRQQLMAEAGARADELVKKAQEDIALERERVLAEVRLSVVDMTLQATERLLGENVDDERNRRLVQEFIDKAEVHR